MLISGALVLGLTLVRFNRAKFDENHDFNFFCWKKGPQVLDHHGPAFYQVVKKEVFGILKSWFFILLIKKKFFDHHNFLLSDRGWCFQRVCKRWGNLTKNMFFFVHLYLNCKISWFQLLLKNIIVSLKIENKSTTVPFRTKPQTVLKSLKHSQPKYVTKF